MATIKVRVGQKNGVKVVASNTSVSVSRIGSASDVDTGARDYQYLPNVRWD